MECIRSLRVHGAPLGCRRGLPLLRLLRVLAPGFCLLAAILLGGSNGCGGAAAPRAEADADPGVVDLTDPKTPIPPERFLMPEVASIAPGDLIYLKALSYEDLNGQLMVANDGRINVSLLGSVQAAGLTLQQLDDSLTARYSTYFRNFDLAVVLVESAARNVYVLGQVRNPGRFAFGPGDRVVHSLVLAGGLMETARENSIILMRREPDGVDHAYRLDFARLHQALAPKDIYLQPGDLVFVPKSRFRTFTDFAKEFLDVAQRTAITALLVDDLVWRQRVENISVAR